MTTKMKSIGHDLERLTDYFHSRGSSPLQRDESSKWKFNRNSHKLERRNKNVILRRKPEWMRSES